MKSLVALIVGFIPLPIGYGIHLFLTFYDNNTNLSKPLDLISIIFFLLWGLLGFLLCRFTKTKTHAFVICHIPAFIVLTLILFQELINKKYWGNIWGFATQFFYMPTIRISFIVQPNFMHYMWQTYIISFVLMLIVFYLGGLIRDKIYPSKKL